MSLPTKNTMDFKEARHKFIMEWGCLAGNWGVNKAMGHIHAFLLIMPKGVCADEISEQLEMSRGNVAINLKMLLEWELVYKENKTGCRKDYYRAEKDMWRILQRVLDHRKKRELDPLIRLIEDTSMVEPLCMNSKEFCEVINNLEFFTTKINSSLNQLLLSKDNWLTGSFSRIS